MLFSVLIYETPGVADARPSDEHERVLKGHRQLQLDTKKTGSFVSSVQLSETGAATVRYRKGETVVTDGPFPETKELFIGLYLFECENLDEALRYGKRVAMTMKGHVEVRPVVWCETRPFETT